jgi:thioredoxin-related protein
MKKIFACLFAILTCASFPAFAEDGVPALHNLQQDAQAAQAKHGVILVALVAENCQYCEHVLNDFLIPMSHNKSYQDRLVMRRLLISDTGDIKDFDGTATNAGFIVGRYGYRFTPTVMLLDSEGNLIGKPVIGLSTPDFYGANLDNAIDAAVAKVRSQTTAQSGG